jgi:hypothetical protein
MEMLHKDIDQVFPLEWANLDYLPASKGYKTEIYLTDYENLVEGLILMFYTLFKNTKNEIKIYNYSWWDYCLDTWIVVKEEYDYGLKGKSAETKDYLLMLQESNIEYGYSGGCSCNDWGKFLLIALKCVVTYQAPYSPIFYSKKNNFFFYFHHTGSIGFYYKDETDMVLRILDIANEEYDVR